MQRTPNNRIAVFDTTLRDGEQAPGFHMTGPEKQRIAVELAKLGVDVMEAGFPASSPEDFAAVRAIAETVGRAPGAPEICAIARCVDTDIDAAVEAVSPATRGRVHVFIATSDLHAQFKLKMTRPQILARIRNAVERAARSGHRVQFSAEDASRTDPAFLLDAVRTALTAGARTINIPDTVGYALPDEFAASIRSVRDVTAAFPGAVVSVHCHDDLGMAVANAMSGARAGARQIEGTINGIGERAGNCSLEEIVMAIKTREDAVGLWTDVRTPHVTPVSRMICDVTGQPVAANKAIVGSNAFAHASGIHQDGMMKNRATYEIMSPAEVGAEGTRFVLTARSGRTAIRSRLEVLGIGVPEADFEEVYRRFKTTAETRKVVTDDDLRSMTSQSGVPTPGIQADI